MEGSPSPVPPAPKPISPGGGAAAEAAAGEDKPKSSEATPVPAQEKGVSEPLALAGAPTVEPLQGAPTAEPVRTPPAGDVLIASPTAEAQRVVPPSDPAKTAARALPRIEPVKPPKSAPPGRGKVEMMKFGAGKPVSSVSGGKQTPQVSSFQQFRRQPAPNISNPQSQLPPKFADFDFPSLDGLKDDLLKHQVLYVSCTDRSIAGAAGFRLAFEMVGDTTLHSITSVHSITVNEEHVQVVKASGNALSLAALAKDPGFTGGVENAVVVIDVSDESFASSLNASELAYSDEGLRNRNLFFIVAVSGKQQTLIAPRVDEESMFPIWQVEFDEPLCRRHDATGLEEAGGTDFIARLREQRQRKLWSEGDEDHLRELRRILYQSGFPELRRRVEEKESQAELGGGGARGIGRSGNPGSEPGPEMNRCQRAIYFAATFLPRLSMGSFKQTLKVLFLESDVEETVETKERIVDGKHQEEKIKHSTLCSKRWAEDPDELLASCGLEAVEPFGDEGEVEEVDTESVRGIVVDYTDAEMHRRMRRQLKNKHAFYVRQCFERLLIAGCLVAPDVPDDLTRRMVELATEMVRQSPDDFGEKWLFSVVAWTYHRIFEQQAEEIADPEEAFRKGFARFIEEVDRRWRRGIVYDRLARLCRELLRIEGTSGPRRVVNAFLRRLVQASEFNDDAVQLLQRLNDLPRSDYDGWLRQLLDQGSDKVWGEIHWLLVTEARGGVLGCQPVLRRLWKWPGDKAETVDQVPRSRRHALALIEGLTSEEWERFLATPTSQRATPAFLVAASGGPNTPGTPIGPDASTASSTAGTNGEPVEPMDVLLGDWLSHRALPRALLEMHRLHGDEKFGEEESEAVYVIAETLIRWECMSRASGGTIAKAARQRLGTRMDRATLLRLQTALMEIGRFLEFAVGDMNRTGMKEDETLLRPRLAIAFELASEINHYLRPQGQPPKS